MTETPACYGSVPQSDFMSQYIRLFEAAECKTQKDLAAFLEVRPASICAARRCQFLPFEWLVKLFEKKQINPHWVRTGTGSKILHSSGAAAANIPHIPLTEHSPVAVCTVKDCTTDELFAEILRRATKAMR